MRIGISERLAILVGLPNQRGIQSWKDVDCAKTVVSRDVLKNPIQVGSKTIEVPALRDRRNVAQLVVILRLLPLPSYGHGRPKSTRPAILISGPDRLVVLSADLRVLA